MIVLNWRDGLDWEEKEMKRMLMGVLVAIISRVILAMFWFAIQTVNGGDTVQVMITAIWPSFARLPNHIPADQGITTAQMVSFFLCE